MAVSAVIKPKNCKICKKDYIPRNSLQKVCSPNCALLFERKRKAAERVKSIRLRKKQDKERLKTKTERLQDLQFIFNKYIRLRDRHKPCVSCGQPASQGQRHASHYRSRAAAAQLRFNFLQVWASCAQCNSAKSGNIVEYRIELVRRIGEKRVLAIEHNNDKADYSVEYIERFKKILKKRIKHYSR